jgi:lysine 2,3-aminomutase
MTKPRSIKTLKQLVSHGVLSAVTPELESVASQFEVSISPAMVALIDPAAPNDPIAAQFVPSVKELKTRREELADPIGDVAYSPVEGIIHRYPDRVLLMVSHACPVHCRFCFRRGQAGQKKRALTAAALNRALAYIENHPEIWEVILSGGDPLMLSDRRLLEVRKRLDAIAHVKVIRLHTRVPVAKPSRITPKLIKALRGKKPVYVLLHCNHARELTPAARAACARLVDRGIPMLSQSVLLRGVNDDPESLRDLMRALVENRVKPHYLHHGDLARGTSHFRVSIAKGQALMRSLRGNLSGLCQPSYMLDIPGGAGKAPIGPVYVFPDGEGWIIEDYRGHRHVYKDIL